MSSSFSTSLPIYLPSVFFIAIPEDINCYLSALLIYACVKINGADIYSIIVINRNETVPFKEMWMDLETVIESEVRKRKTNPTS